MHKHKVIHRRVAGLHEKQQVGGAGDGRVADGDCGRGVGHRLVGDHDVLRCEQAQHAALAGEAREAGGRGVEVG